MKPLTLFAFVSASLLVAGCGKINWKDFESTDGKFSIKMPGESKSQSQSMPLPGGGAATLKMHMVEMKNAAYGVGHADFPQGTPFDYAGAVQGMANSNGGTVTKENDWKFEGATGQEVEMKITKPRNGYCSARIIVLGNRLYEVIAIGTNTSLDNSDVKTFFDSFKIIK
jgi:hypothetical protein